MLFESQIFGVIVGAAIAGLTAVLLEVSRRRADRWRRSQELRQRVHADAVKAVFDLRETLIRLYLVTDSAATSVRGGGGRVCASQPPSHEEERATAFTNYDTAFTNYDEADRKVAEMVYMVESFGSPGVTSALREFGQVTRWHVHKYWQTPVNERLVFTDLENVMEYLISVLCEETRRDADVAYGAKRSLAKLEDGRPTWLGGLKDMGAYQAAKLESEGATTESARPAPGQAPAFRSTNCRRV
jgi:hypothetical protein